MDTNHRFRRPLGLFLGLLFALAMIMGVGPGVLLVNHPDTLLGLPRIYTWALLWYAIHVVIAATAYRFLWRQPPDRDQRERDRERE